MFSGEPVNGYTIVNNYWNGPLGQAAIEFFSASLTSFANNILVQYNTFDQCELYGTVEVGGENVTFQHNYSTACAEGNENNNAPQVSSGCTGQEQYLNIKMIDEELHFGGGNGCYSHPSIPGCVSTPIANMYIQVCGNDNAGTGCTAQMNGSTGLGQNLIVNGDGTGFRVVPGDACTPSATMTGNTLLNGATCNPLNGSTGTC